MKEIQLVLTFLLLINAPAQSASQTLADFKGVVDEVSLDGSLGKIVVFKGIRYAKTPERFAVATLQEPESPVHDALDFGAVCPQTDSGKPGVTIPPSSEDCLFLNVYVPYSEAPVTQEETAPENITPQNTPTSKKATTQKPTTQEPNTPKPTPQEPTTQKPTTSTPKTPETTSQQPTTSEEPKVEDPTPNPSENDTTENEDIAEPTGDNLLLNRKRRDVQPMTTSQMDRSKKRPILIFIHGGFFSWFWAHAENPSGLVAFGDVIVVTLNYRLGPFGFLTTDTDDIPKNLALKDQQIAIQWVKKYALSFGGDPDRITVGGQSAGSISAVLQGMNPENKGLFQNVMALSGTPDDLSGLSSNAKGFPIAQKTAAQVGCVDTSTPAKVKECLVNATTEELLRMNPRGSGDFTLPFMPVSDDSLTKGEHFLEKNLLIGFTQDDGEVLLSLISRVLGITRPNILFLKIFFAKFTGTKMNSLTVNAIVDRYIDWENPVDLKPPAWKFLTDVSFGVPSVQTAVDHITMDNPPVGRRRRAARQPIAHAQSAEPVSAMATGKTFMYIFNLAPELQVSFMQKYKGSPHSVGKRYFFGEEDKLLKTDNPQTAFSLSWACMDYMAAFIKTGVPFHRYSNQPAKEMTQDRYSYTEFSGAVPEEKVNPAANAEHFLTEIVPLMKKTEAEL